MRTPLFMNSIFMLLASISSAGFGLIFWFIAAKFYPTGDIGIASALISLMGLIVLISKFGLDFSIIRFFPTNDKNRIFSTSIFITTIFAMIFGSITIFGIDTISPELHLLKSVKNSTLFLIFLLANSAVALCGTSFIAIRKTDYYLIQNIFIGSRVLLLIPLIFFGSIGIFSAVGMSFILSLIISLILLAKFGIKFKAVIDTSFLKKAFHYSMGNYFVGVSQTGLNSIIPILVLNTLGPEEAAYYYITFALTSLILFTIPNVMSMSLFVEGSHGEALKMNVIKSICGIFVIIVPLIILLNIFGDNILGFFGAEYAENGFELLKVMSLTSLVVSVNRIYFSIKRVQKDIKGIIIISSLTFGLLIGLGYIFMMNFGLVGIGYAWLVSYTVAAIAIVVISGRKLN